MSIFVLVDCNNFFVSCERLFQPSLIGRPVIVLSNNDGCVVARSAEAKRLGIKMGIPYFAVRDLCRFHRVEVLSSNFSLYGDISQRVMAVLKDCVPEIEVYSIDEAFIQFPFEITIEQLVKKCVKIRKKIEQWVGIPVSMGIGAAKTLAKAANAIAKTKPEGVFELLSSEMQESNLKQFPVEKLWGVGRGFQSRLAVLGIRSAWQLRQADPGYIRKKMGVVGERLVYELRGVSCLSLEETVQPKQSITCSRSFGRALMEIGPIAEAIATHTASACVKLREERSFAQAIQIFLEASAASGFRRREYQGVTLSFPMPMNDTGKIISIAKSGLPHLFQQGKRYKKAGVIMLGLIPEDQLCTDLFMNPIDPKRQRLAATVDFVNEQMGKRTLFYGAMGIEQKWRMLSGNRSKRYTSCWKELATVFAN